MLCASWPPVTDNRTFVSGAFHPDRDKQALQARVGVLCTMLQERDTLLMQFQDLKGQMSRLHSTEHQGLVKLTTLCDTALKDLKATRAKVEYLPHTHTHKRLTAFFPGQPG